MYHVIVVTLLLVWLAPAVCPYKVSLGTQTPTPQSNSSGIISSLGVGWSHTSTMQRSPSLMCTHFISHPDTLALIVMTLGSYTTGDYKKWNTAGCGLTYLQLAVYLALLWLQVRQSSGKRLLSSNYFGYLYHWGLQEVKYYRMWSSASCLPSVAPLVAEFGDETTVYCTSYNYHILH